MGTWQGGVGLSTLALIIMVGLTAIYSGVSAYMADQLSRPPRNSVLGSPADFGLKFDRVEFISWQDEIKLRGWWIPAPDSDRAVIMVHGRTGNRSDTDGLILRQVESLVNAGYSVLSFDLRGHGESGGVRYSLGPMGGS